MPVMVLERCLPHHGDRCEYYGRPWWKAFMSSVRCACPCHRWK